MKMTACISNLPGNVLNKKLITLAVTVAMDNDITKPNRNLVCHGLLEDSMKNPSTINSVPSIPENTEMNYTGVLANYFYQGWLKRTSWSQEKEQYS
ncbi:MAG: hypothetical protein QXK87_06865 [Fervidicoccaceae archaeon]